MEFHGANSDFVSSLGLSHEDNIHKMRILTFMSMSVGDSKVIPFTEIQLHLQLAPEDVESKEQRKVVDFVKIAEGGGYISVVF